MNKKSFNVIFFFRLHIGCSIIELICINYLKRLNGIFFIEGFLLLL